MEHTVEALDAGVLDCIVDHVPRVQSHRQRHESPAGEPRPLIGADGQVLASEVRGSVQQVQDVLVAHQLSMP